MRPASLLLASLGRLLALVIVIVLALLGLVAAVFAIQGGDDSLSYSNAASLAGLPSLRDSVGSFLSDLESGDGILEGLAIGLAMIFVGLLLLFVGFGRRAPRDFELASSEDGSLGARRTALLAAARVRAESVSGVTRAKVSGRPRRRRAKLKVKASRVRGTDEAAVDSGLRERLAQVGDPFGLSVDSRSEIAREGDRVE